jgi:AcrR family transcriptional regulator
VVRASQRARLLQAMVELVGRDGYRETTVPAVVARARVSRNAFYALFSDKADCFVAVCVEHASELLVALETAAPDDDWRTRVSAGMTTYLRWWQSHPDYCRAYFVELPAAGPQARAARDAQFERFGRMFEALAAQARREQPELPPLAVLNVRLIVLAITELIGQEWRAGRSDRLPRFHGELVAFVVRMLSA